MLCDSLDGRGVWERMDMCMYGWVPSLFTWNYCTLFLVGYSVQFSSVQLLNRVRLCDPMNRSMPGLPVHHQLLEFTQTHVHWVGDAHPAISFSVVPFSFCSQSLPASESFPVSQLFASGGQSSGVSALASFLPKNTQDLSPLEWTGWIYLTHQQMQEM